MQAIGPGENLTVPRLVNLILFVGLQAGQQIDCQHFTLIGVQLHSLRLKLTDSHFGHPAEILQVMA